jgi:hypothetical protein
MRSDAINEEHEGGEEKTLPQIRDLDDIGERVLDHESVPR